MADYSNDNTLVLFVNENKVEGSKQPDYKGKATVEGKEYKCAGWKKIGKTSGKPYLSVVFEDADAFKAEAAPAPRAKTASAGSDDIPF